MNRYFTKPSASLIAFTTFVFLLPIVTSGGMFAIVEPSFIAIPLALAFLAVSTVLLVTRKRKLIWLSVLVVVFSSCASPNYWSASATGYGAKAQQKYIKNQKGHHPERRFQKGQSTWGAQDISRSK